MRNLMITLAVLVGAAGCGKSIPQQCQDQLQANCDKTVACGDGGFGQYKTATECVTALSALLSDAGLACANKTDSNACAETHITFQADGGTSVTTTNTKKYDSAKADQCIDTLKAAACSDLTTLYSKTPCSDVCK